MKTQVKNRILNVWLSQLNIQASLNVDKEERRYHRALVRDMEYLCNRKDIAGQTVCTMSPNPLPNQEQVHPGQELMFIWKAVIKNSWTNIS